MTHQLAGVLFVVVSIPLFTLACSGSSSSPTAPPTQAPSIRVATPWGSIALSPGECGEVDTDLLVDSVKKGYQRARAVAGSVVDSITLEGMTMHGQADLKCSGTAAYGCYFFNRDQVLFRCGYENVIEHELQHRFCDQLKRPCDCYQTDHPGGVDLNCQPV